MIAVRSVALAAGMMLTSGCAIRFPPDASTMRPCAIAAAPAANGLYFVTSRAVDCPDKAATPVLTTGRGAALSYGQFTPDGTPALANPDDWNARLGGEIGAAGRVIVYVHGYNNDFGVAARRAAVIRAAAGGATPVILFSWPSQGAAAKYPWDENNAAWTQPDMDALLASLTGVADSVTLVAHSMGTRLAVAALLRLQDHDEVAAARVDRLILAAADIDRVVLTRYSRRDLLANDLRVTLYVSRLDRAVEGGWIVHGYPRAGDPSCRPDLRRRPDRHPPDIIAERCYWPPGSTGPWPEVVDLSNVSDKPSSIGHADFLESQGGYADLCRVLAGDKGDDYRKDRIAPAIWLLRKTKSVTPLHC